MPPHTPGEPIFVFLEWPFYTGFTVLLFEYVELTIDYQITVNNYVFALKHNDQAACFQRVRQLFLYHKKTA